MELQPVAKAALAPIGLKKRRLGALGRIQHGILQGNHPIHLHTLRRLCGVCCSCCCTARTECTPGRDRTRLTKTNRGQDGIEPASRGRTKTNPSPKTTPNRSRTQQDDPESLQNGAKQHQRTAERRTFRGLHRAAGGLLPGAAGLILLRMSSSSLENELIL